MYYSRAFVETGQEGKANRKKCVHQSTITTSDTQFLFREFGIHALAYSRLTTPPPVRSASPPPKWKLVYFLYLTKGRDRISSKDVECEAVSQRALVLSHCCI